MDRIVKRDTIVVAAFSFLAAITFLFWLIYDPVAGFTASLPGLDNRPSKGTGKDEKVEIGSLFKLFATEESNLQGEWTRFRGKNFNNHAKSSVPLINSFGGKPKVLWQVKLGEGHAAPVVKNGKVYLLDYTEEKKEDALRCFSLKTGKELWQRGYKVHVKRNHGMSRTVPAITDKYIVTMGPRGHVMCVDPQTGDLRWGLDLEKKYGTEIPFWYTGQCPMIDNGVAVLAPGGKAILIGVDCESGKVLWETANPDSIQMSHSSIMPMLLGGKKTYLYAGIGAMVGVSAEGDDLGKVLWKTTAFSPNVVAPSPVVLEDGKVFMTAGYGAGAVLLQVSPKDYKVKVLEQYKPKEGLASEQQTPILWNGHLFGILPKDAGSLRNQFVCTKLNDPKKILWNSGKNNRFGLGPYVLADGKFFILNDNGTLSIAKASTKGFQLLDKAQIIKGHDAWGPLAIVEGYLLMRDSKNLVCVDIRK